MVLTAKTYCLPDYIEILPEEMIPVHEKKCLEILLE